MDRDAARAQLQHDLLTLLNPRGYRLESQSATGVALIRPMTQTAKGGLALLIFGVLVAIGGAWYVGAPAALVGAGLFATRRPGRIAARVDATHSGLGVTVQGRPEPGVEALGARLSEQWNGR